MEYHQLNRPEFEQTLGGGEGQGSLMCCSPWGRKESDTTERLNSNNNSMIPSNLHLEMYTIAFKFTGATSIDNSNIHGALHGRFAFHLPV